MDKDSNNPKLFDRDRITVSPFQPRKKDYFLSISFIKNMQYEIFREEPETIVFLRWEDRPTLSGPESKVSSTSIIVSSLPTVTWSRDRVEITFVNVERRSHRRGCL